MDRASGSGRICITDGFCRLGSNTKSANGAGAHMLLPGRGGFLDRGVWLVVPQMQPHYGESRRSTH
jgi:hypothetical protein